MQAGAEAQGGIQRGSSVISAGTLVSTGSDSPWSIVRIGQYNPLYLGNNQKITRTGLYGLFFFNSSTKLFLQCGPDF